MNIFCNVLEKRSESIMFALTLGHVVVSLVGIVTGFVVAADMLSGRQRGGWTAWFLATTVLTSVSGFLFPVDRILPSHVLGVLSLIVLGVALYAQYVRHLVGHWRTTYIVTALTAQHFNVFVLVVQSFLKVPALKALAPTQTEPVFAIVQLGVLLGFLVLGTLAVYQRSIPAVLPVRRA
jgi:hypothetical protein